MTPSRSITRDRERLRQIMLVAGVVGIAAALIVGIVGWYVAGRATRAIADTIAPISGIAGDLADSIEASEVLFDRTTEAIESIETAARSTVRALESVSLVLDETSDLVAGDIADSLDAAVDSLPALVSTAGVIDTTMRALSFVGVDYDPAEPLDASLAELEASLAPIPEQLRAQVDLLEGIETDLDQIAEDGRELSGVLLEARLDMLDAERVLRSTSANATAAAESVAAIEADVETYDTLARVAVVAATLALLVGAAGPLAIGLYLGRDDDGSSYGEQE